PNGGLGREEARRRRVADCVDRRGRRRPRAPKGGRPMIRINLLGGERQVKKRAFTFDSSRQIMVACSLLLVLTVVGIGYWFWSLQQASTQVDADIAEAQREQQRLQSILRDVTAFDQQRDQLQQRVALIEQLRGGQSIPVQLLDEVSKS